MFREILEIRHEQGYGRMGKCPSQTADVPHKKRAAVGTKAETDECKHENSRGETKKNRRRLAENTK